MADPGIFHKLKFVLFILVLVFFTLTGLYWLTGWILILVLFHRLYKSNQPFFVRIRQKMSVNFLVSILYILILSISVRIFFFEVFVIPSGSMENTLIKGDKVVISKLNYGPLLPGSPLDIPWINLFWYFSKKTNPDSVYRDFKRLKGYSRVKHNDVIVFLHPLRNKEDNFYIKRCTGLPGDTFQIKNGSVFINNQALTVPCNLKLRYQLKIADQNTFQKTVKGLNLQRSGKSHEKGSNEMELLLTRFQANQLATRNREFGINSIHSLEVSGDSINWVFPKERRFSWTIDHYGPVVIPFKGMTISLNTANYQIYQRTINLLEKQKLLQKNGIFYLNDRRVDCFTFQHDYYFMMGDNRSDSNDSRFWGFVPQENIVGKAWLVAFSSDGDGFHWERFFKIID